MSSQTTRPLFHATTAELVALATKDALAELKFRKAKRKACGKSTRTVKAAIKAVKATRAGMPAPVEAKPAKAAPAAKAKAAPAAKAKAAPATKAKRACPPKDRHGRFVSVVNPSLMETMVWNAAE